MQKSELPEFLNRKVSEYNRPAFIARDPVSIPHLFSQQADIEIAGFFAAIFSWGNRTTIIRKSKELMDRMDMAPHQFIREHGENDLKKLLGFRHRTFNDTDLLYFVRLLQHHYLSFDSLEDAFLSRDDEAGTDSPVWAESALNHFHEYFFSLDDVPHRTRKHIAWPRGKSTCKRLNMFLRWMVRRDDRGVDFGLWRRCPPGGLVCPIDLHVARVARKFELLHRKATDWQAALELTSQLRILDAQDPVKYDFALFALGIIEHF